MKYFDLIKEKLSSLLPMWLLIMFVAIWSICIQDGHINRDGLLYLKQAYLIAEGSWKEGLALYSWPFFSILIAFLNKITGIHLQVAAHAIDLLLFGISLLFYLKTLQLVYKQKNIIFYGGLILLSFIPIMDDYVAVVVRDHGLWAGCMMGTYYYFKSTKISSIKESFFWQGSFLFAGLFRPEGLIYLLILPLWNFWYIKNKRCKQLLCDYGLLIALISMSLIAILISGVDVLSILNSSRLNEIVQRPLQFILQLFQGLPLTSSNYYLTILLENNSILITYSVLISVLIFKWIKGLGFLHGILFFYQLFKPEKNDYRYHLYFFLIISFILVNINLFNVYVLSNRYWVFHWWWMLILVTKTLASLLDSMNTKYYIKYCLFILIAFLFLNTLIDKSLIDKSVNLEQEVAQYILDNNLIDIDYQNNDRIKYYVNYDVKDLLKHSNETKFKYRVVKNINKKSDEIDLVIKNFPKHEPKYILIKNVQ